KVVCCSVPRIVRDVDPAAELWPAGKVALEPLDGFGEIGGLLGQRVPGGGVAEVAEVQAFRPSEQRVRGGRLVHVEQEVAPALQHQRWDGERVELRTRGARRFGARDGMRDLSGEQVGFRLGEGRIPLCVGYLREEIRKKAGLRDVVRVEPRAE